MDDLNRNWLLVSQNPDRWINIATARGLDVSKDGTSKLWWISNAAPALLNKAETQRVLDVIGPWPLAASEDGALPFPEPPSPPTPLSSLGEGEPIPPAPLEKGGEMEGRLRRLRRRVG